MKRRAATTEASATAKTSATPAVETASTASVAAADFGREPVGGVFRYRQHARIDQRQRLRALAWCGRQRQHRSSRRAQATDKAAPGISYLQHV
jgi:hypothetical protein